MREAPIDKLKAHITTSLDSIKDEGLELQKRIASLEKALKAAREEIARLELKIAIETDRIIEQMVNVETDRDRLRAEVETWKLNAGRQYMAGVRNGVPELETDEAMNLKDTDEALKALRASKSSQDREVRGEPRPVKAEPKKAGQGSETRGLPGSPSPPVDYCPTCDPDPEPTPENEILRLKAENASLEKALKAARKEMTRLEIALRTRVLNLEDERDRLRAENAFFATALHRADKYGGLKHASLCGIQSVSGMCSCSLNRLRKTLRASKSSQDRG